MTVPEQLNAIADRIGAGDSDTAGIASALRNVARELERVPVSGLYTITMRKEAYTWIYRVKNPVGALFSGSMDNVAQRIALQSALELVPPGARYLVITNGEPDLEQTKPA